MIDALKLNSQYGMLIVVIDFPEANSAELENVAALLETKDGRAIGRCFTLSADHNPTKELVQELNGYIPKHGSIWIITASREKEDRPIAITYYDPPNDCKITVGPEE